MKMDCPHILKMAAPHLAFFLERNSVDRLRQVVWVLITLPGSCASLESDSDLKLFPLFARGQLIRLLPLLLSGVEAASVEQDTSVPFPPLQYYQHYTQKNLTRVRFVQHESNIMMCNSHKNVLRCEIPLRTKFFLLFSNIKLFFQTIYILVLARVNPFDEVCFIPTVGRIRI